MELSTLIGKQILTAAGENLGYTKNAYLTRDGTKLSSLVCIDGDEEEFFLPARTILAADDVIIAGKARLSAPTGVPCPIGIAAYSARGELLGAVTDLLLGDGAAPVYVIVKDGIRTTYAADCVAAGETLIVYPEGKPKKTAPPRRRETQKKEQKPAPPPPEENASYRCNLLGRCLKKTVYDGYGYPIAVAGERITAGIIARARKNNRLLQLTVNTLTNIY